MLGLGYGNSWSPEQQGVSDWIFLQHTWVSFSCYRARKFSLKGNVYLRERLMSEYRMPEFSWQVQVHSSAVPWSSTSLLHVTLLHVCSTTKLSLGFCWIIIFYQWHANQGLHHGIRKSRKKTKKRGNEPAKIRTRSWKNKPQKATQNTTKINDTVAAKIHHANPTYTSRNRGKFPFFRVDNRKKWNTLIFGAGSSQEKIRHWKSQKTGILSHCLTSQTRPAVRGESQGGMQSKWTCAIMMNKVTH